MVKSITLSFLVSCMFAIAVQADTYPGVVFENSVLKGNYMYSDVHHDNQSWVENVAGRLPVSDSIFFTPANSLSLRYLSAKTGNWHTGITFPEAVRSYFPDARSEEHRSKLQFLNHTSYAVLCLNNKITTSFTINSPT